MTGMAAVRATLYNTLMRRNSVYVTACLLGSYTATHMYFKGTDSLWKSINKGVRSKRSKDLVPFRPRASYNPEEQRC